VIEERCLTNKAVFPLVAELAQRLVPSRFASLIQAAPRNLSSPHDPAAERGASSLSTGLGQSQGLVSLAGLRSPGELPLATGTFHRPGLGCRAQGWRSDKCQAADSHLPLKKRLNTPFEGV